MVAGAMLVIEAAITLAWQEPISAAIAARSQAALEDDLDNLAARAAREQAALEEQPSKKDIVARLAYLQERRLETNDAVGEISMPTQGRSYTIVE